MQNQNRKSNKAIKQTETPDWIQLPHQRLVRQLKKTKWQKNSIIIKNTYISKKSKSIWRNTKIYHTKITKPRRIMGNKTTKTSKFMTTMKKC